MSALSADLQVQRGEFTLDVHVDVAAGEVLAVLGPNGSGKSTLLGALTGELTGTTSVRLGDRIVDGIPTHRRGIAVLSQAPLLFPHLSVLSNVSFGPRAKKVGKASANAEARKLLARVDAADLENRKPAQISGGQAQRVALARALAVAPDLLLLDEPFAALDVTSAPRMRALIASVLSEAQETATVLVTHDPLDALVLADRVAVIDGGRVVEQGPARAVLSAPSTPFAAYIAGLNLVTGTVSAEGLRTAEGAEVVGVHTDEARRDGPGAAVFAPTAVAVYRSEHENGSPRNVVPAVLATAERAGDLVRLGMTPVEGGPAWVDGVRADITPAALAELDVRPGERVWLVIKAAEVSVHPKRVT